MISVTLKNTWQAQFKKPRFCKWLKELIDIVDWNRGLLSQ
nr:MAG TPA: hypothetical protein [Bacteriophage sp.]